MAVSHIGGTAHNELDPTTTCTVTVHASAAANDLDFLIATNRNGTADLSVTDDDSGTWALLHKQVSDTSRSGQLWWRRSAPAGTIITVDGATNSISAACSLFRGGSTGVTPYEAVVGEGNASGDEAQAETTLSAGSMAVFGVCQVLNNLTASSVSAATLGAFASSIHSESSGGSDCAVDLFYALSVSGGATGAMSWSQTNNITASFIFGVLIEEVGGVLVPRLALLGVGD